MSELRLGIRDGLGAGRGLGTWVAAHHDLDVEVMAYEIARERPPF